MSYFEMLYLGVVLVAFLGFGGTLLYCSERWSNSQRRLPGTLPGMSRFNMPDSWTERE